MSPEQTVFILVDFKSDEMMHWSTPSKEETQIRCEKLHGAVAYGELVLNGEEVA